MTSRNYLKVEQVKTWLLISNLAKFQQFQSECFFQFCFSLFRPDYMVHVQFLSLGSCVSFVFFSVPRLDFLIFLVCNLQTVITCSPFFRKVFGLLFLFLKMELWICSSTWYNYHCRLPCDGQLRLSNFEPVKTWLLSSSLAKFQQFPSEFSFFSKLCWVQFFLVTRSIFFCCI